VAGRRTIFASGSINWNEGQIRIMLSGSGGEVANDTARRARAVQKRAQRRAPFRTGRLRYSISVSNDTSSTDGPTSTVTAGADYSMMVEFGRSTVRPAGKRLYWQGDFGPVFALEAGPVGEVPFMREALDAVNESV
jgi:hypothetical protein